MILWRPRDGLISRIDHLDRRFDLGVPADAPHTNQARDQEGCILSAPAIAHLLILRASIPDRTARRWIHPWSAMDQRYIY